LHVGEGLVILGFEKLLQDKVYIGPVINDFATRQTKEI